MREDQLYNQLRFNLEQPYDTNRLSVRHSKPKLVTIEKAGGLAPVQVESVAKEDALSDGFSSLNLSKLKEAQFLAKRELKKQKDSLLVGDAHKTSAKFSSPRRNLPAHKTAATQALKVKVSPTKKSHHLLACGNSPPVRDVSSAKAKTYTKRNLQKRLSSPQKTKASGTQIRRTQSNGVLQEKLDTDRDKLTVPDVHKMAMLQLLQVQDSEIPPSAIRKTEKGRQSPAKSRGQRSSSGRQRSAPGSAVKFMKASTRAEAARKVREGIYRQPLARPLPRGSRLHPHVKARVLPRHPTLPQYDPDYDYVDPETHLNDSIYELKQSEPQRSQDLPNADEFLNRITEARRVNEAAERYAGNPTKFVDDVEREARQRLEPLLKQAEALSADIKRGINSRNPTTVCTITPQYNGGHDSAEMSADNLLEHPVESQTMKAAGSSSQAMCGVVDGHAQGSNHNVVEGQQSTTTYAVSTDDRMILQSMLERLDEMQKEHIEIRHRWLTASTKYEDAGLVHLDEGADGDDSETGEHVFEAPRPLLLKKPQGAQAMNPSKTSSVGFPLPPHSKTVANLRHNKPSTYPALDICLPEKKIKSITDGKKRFQRHLENNGQASSAGFDPWIFAKQTADEILDSCITQVSRELLEVGDDIVQRLYSDEFIAAKHDTDNEHSTLLT